MSSKSAKETTATSMSVTTKHTLKISHFRMEGEEGDDYSKPFIEIGVDEAGRGPMFGRVYVGAVVLPKDSKLFDFSKMKDSKKFHSEKKNKRSGRIYQIARYCLECKIRRAYRN